MTVETLSPALVGTFDIDPTHSTFGFSARHAMVTKVRGSFAEVSGEGTLNEDEQSGAISVELKTASVDTRNADRDAHLRGEEFFDSAKYPTIVFTSSDVRVVGGELAVRGLLTIKDTAREVAFTLTPTGTSTDPWGGQRLGLEGSLVVNRKDWGLVWNVALEAGGILVSDKVTLEFDLSLVRRA